MALLTLDVLKPLPDARRSRELWRFLQMRMRWNLEQRRFHVIPLDEATLLAPVEPSKIVCVGRNCIVSMRLNWDTTFQLSR